MMGKSRRERKVRCICASFGCSAAQAAGGIVYNNANTTPRCERDRATPWAARSTDVGITYKKRRDEIGAVQHAAVMHGPDQAGASQGHQGHNGASSLRLQTACRRLASATWAPRTSLQIVADLAATRTRPARPHCKSLQIVAESTPAADASGGAGDFARPAAPGLCFALHRRNGV